MFSLQPSVRIAAVAGLWSDIQGLLVIIGKPGRVSNKSLEYPDLSDMSNSSEETPGFIGKYLDITRSVLILAEIFDGTSSLRTARTLGY
jgi:hypothetical protein